MVLNRIKSSCFVLSIVLVLCGCPLYLCAEDVFDTRLTHIEGTVEIIPQDVDSDGGASPGSIDMSLEEGDQISTGPNSTAEISLDGESVVLLSEKSTFKIKSQKRKQSEFFLALGSLVAKIKSLSAGEKMSVRTPIAVAAVRGTEFAVAQKGEDQPASIAVYDEGEVSVENVDGGEVTIIRPQEEVEIGRGVKIFKPRPLMSMAHLKPRIELVRRRINHLRPGWHHRSIEDRRKVRHEWLENHRKNHLPRIRPKDHKEPNKNHRPNHRPGPQKRHQK